jgi:uridine kinase
MMGLPCGDGDSADRRQDEVLMGHDAIPLVVGVAGGTGAGKTTISQAILDDVGRDRIAYIQHDAYYRDLGHLTMAKRREQNMDHPNALETELLLEHLALLKRGVVVRVPVYDFAAYRRTERTTLVEPRPVILVEGILVLATPELRDELDVKVYVDADADIRLIRRLQRDILERGRDLQTVIAQYLDTVRPMHLQFVEPSKRYADVIIPEGGRNRVALEMICARLRASLGDG